jgi:hypothetical protein
MIRTRFVVALLLVSFILPACVEDDQFVGSMLVVHNSRLSDACELEAAVEGDFLARGSVDIMLTNRYFLNPTIQNQLLSSKDVKIVSAAGGGAMGDFRDGLVEGNNIVLEGATVSFTTPANVSFALPQNVFIPVSGTVPPQGVTTTALEVLNVDVGNIVRRAPEFFDAANETFRKTAVVTVLVSVIFKGHTTAGTEVFSNEFTFPVDMCAGCLLVHPPGTLFTDDDNSLTCDTAAAVLGDGEVVDTADVATPCLLGQDDTVDCRLCRTLAPDDVTADELCDP